MRFELRVVVVLSLLAPVVAAACGSESGDCTSKCAATAAGGQGGAPPEGSDAAGVPGAADVPSTAGTDAVNAGGVAGASEPGVTSGGAAGRGAGGVGIGGSGCSDADCQLGSACAKDGSGCEYPPGERFVTYSGDDFQHGRGDLVAVPLSKLNKPIRLRFSDGLLDATFWDVGDIYWSPDGRRVVFPSVEFDNISLYEQKFYWLDVRAPLSGPAQRVTDLPINENFAVESWSPDANAFLVGVDTTTYAVRFTDAGTETTGVPASGATALCAGDKLIAYAAADGTHIAALWDKTGKDTLLAGALVSGSPDGQWLLLSDEKHAYLAACAAGAKPEMLGAPAAGPSSWSSDSQFVAYADGSDAPAALSVWQAKSQLTHHAAFQATVADPTVKFRPGSERFVYVAWLDQNTAVWHVEDLAENGGDSTLAVPDGVGGVGDFLSQIEWVHATNLLSYTLSDDFSDSYVLDAVAKAKPRLVVHSDDPNSAPVFTRDGSKAVYVLPGGDQAGATSQVYALDLTSIGAKPVPLFHTALTGSLQLMDDEGRTIERGIDAPESRAELYVLPADFVGEPVLVNGGTFVDTPQLQPQP